MNKAMLGPQIQQLEQQNASPRWSVVCNGASIEELLARFAANANVDIRWAGGNEPASEQIPARKRPVSLYLRDSSPQQVISVAAGAAGLSASFIAAGDKSAGGLKATISNLAVYSALAEHISSVNDEAVSLWHKFILTFGEDKRTANAHFSLGLLQQQKGQLIDAISEYKLVANRYSQNPLASFALLRSGKLRADLRNYTDARTDLKQLVEQYPDSEVTGQAFLYLADATMKAKLYDEAIRLYSKVYNLNISLQSQAAAALGAAKCFYDRKDYEETVKWLGRYIGAVNDPKNSELPFAYLMLGKTNLALGKLPQACKAFQHALAGNLTVEKYAEAESSLAEILIEQGNFIDALNELEGVNPERFSQKDSAEIMLLKSKALRLMELPDNAIAVLGEQTEYITDPQLKARVSLELSRCYIAKGNLQLGQSSLAETLALAEPGPLAQEISAELADVCLKLGQKEQAMSLCSKLLESKPAAGIRQKAMDILAIIYRQQKEYDKAAAILIGEWNGQK
jgi:TolA-binding protein